MSLEKRFNFDEVVDRRGTFCTQWDYIEDRFGEGTKNLIPFSISDMDFKSPQEIIEGSLKRIQHGVFGYTRWNHKEYKGSIKNWYKRRYKTEIEEEWIVYSPSVLFSISLTLETVVGRGGKVMTHTPRYDGFTKFLANYNLYEIKLIADENGDYQTNFDEIEKGFQDGVKAFLLCNPENPTGKVWKREEIEKLLSLCNEYGVLLISDDIHMDVARKEVTPILKVSTENCVIYSSPTKTFNTPGFGGSYGIIPNKDLREKFLYLLKDVYSVSSASILGVLSTIIAYDECEYWVDELNEYLTKNCEYVAKELNGYKGIRARVPEGTYLMWIDFENTGVSMDDLEKKLIEVGKVAIMGGKNYGDPNKLRLNVGASRSKVEKGVEGIKKAIDSLIK